MLKFPLKIGLEVHGYLNTKRKLFCNCKTDFLIAEPNTLTCPICEGKGAKPIPPEEEAIKRVIQIGLILGCKINMDKDLVWQRKHYDYPDSPKGYQITMSGPNTIPNVQGGEFEGIRIREAHLEEDPAQYNPRTGDLNFNRSGLPLIEIVTEPDFKSAEQVVDWLKSLVHSLSYVRALRKNGGIKVDVNISTYGDRSEMKNLNSLEKIKSAIDLEIKRQLENYEKGIIQERETLAFDEETQRITKMRDKESSEDYKHSIDSDLPSIRVSKEEVERIRKELPEMPSVKLEKLIEKYGLEKYDADILIKNLELVDFAEELAQKLDLKKHIHWITIELLRILNYNKKTLSEVEINPEHLVELIEMVDKGDLTVLKAKEILNDFIPKSFRPITLGKLSLGETKKIVEQVLSENQGAYQEYLRGKKESINYLIGKVMSLSNKRADFKKVRELIG